jgi:Tfp pilus assembly protein PilF
MHLSRLQQNSLIYVLLAALTFVVFCPVIHYDFVSFDDPYYIQGNPRVLGGLSIPNILWAFQTGFFANWHPITWLSHMLDVELFGLNPGWHHLVSLLYHVANTLLLFWIFERITGARLPSGIVAALFAVHPLHVESVAWISERKDVLSTFFGLLCLAAYIRFVELSGVPILIESGKPMSPRTEMSRASRYYLASLVFLALGLMSKAMVATIPFVLLLLDCWPLSRYRLSAQNFESLTPSSGPTASVRSLELRTFRQIVREKAPYFVLAILSILTAFLIMRSEGAVRTPRDYSWISRAAAPFISCATYIAKMFWPVNLAVFYPRPQNWPAWQVILSAITIIALTLVALLMNRRRPYLTVGWLWFLVTVAPVSGVAPLGEHSMADRYTYVPLVGLFIVVVWAGADVAQRWRFLQLPLRAASILVVIALAIVSRGQLKYWESSIPLLKHDINVVGSTGTVESNLGMNYYRQNNWQEAEKHILETVRVQPDFQRAHGYLAMIYAQEGRTDDAIQAIRGMTPDWEAEAHRSVAEIFLSQAKTNEAVAQYAAAANLDPTNASTHETLGSLLSQQGRFDAASQQFEALVRLKPDAQSHYHLALALLIQGKAKESVTHYKEAIRLKPDWPEPLNDLAWLFATYPRAELRNGPQAVQLAERACQLTNFKEARFLGTLDAAYAEAGRFPEAITTAEQTKSLALAAGDKNTADLADERLKLYRSGLPFHQQ